MNIFIGGYHDGQDFPFDPDKYEGDELHVPELNTGGKCTYTRHKVDGNVFWVEQSLTDQEIENRIQLLLNSK